MANTIVARHQLVLDYWHLIRPRIVALVLLAMGVSAWTTAATPIDWSRLMNALLGASLVIAGAIALNQRMEWQGDALMFRTALRPLPTGRLSRRQVTCFGLATTAIGLIYLALITNAMLTLLAAVGWLAYVAVYTPLKTRSAWQTPIGAVAGAIPVLLGAAAVGRPLSPWAFVLFGIIYFWQFPHSMAIAWLYRPEFATAGVKVATVTDPTGRTAGILAVLGAAILLPVSLAPVALISASVAYGVAAAVFGTAYLVASILFARRRDDVLARRLLLASLLYLPATFVVLLVL
jgi:heme o synthase